MQDNKDVLEIFEDFSTEQELSNTVTAKAKTVAQELYGDGSKGRKPSNVSIFKRYLIPSMSCLVLLLIAIPLVINLFVNNQEVDRYFDINDLTASRVEDIDSFVIENALSIYYYTDDVGMVENTANYVIETNELGYIKQKLIVMTEMSFDIVELGIVVDNFDFEAFAEYAELDLSIEHLNIEISYKTERSEAQENIIYAYFNVDDVDYYLNIITIEETGVLEKYIELLLN